MSLGKAHQDRGQELIQRESPPCPSSGPGRGSAELGWAGACPARPVAPSPPARAKQMLRVRGTAQPAVPAWVVTAGSEAEALLYRTASFKKQTPKPSSFYLGLSPCCEQALRDSQQTV